MEAEAKNVKNGDEHTILIDLNSGELEIVRLTDLPRAWPMGQFCSLRTGTFKEMDSLRRSLIQNNLKTILRHG